MPVYFGAIPHFAEDEWVEDASDLISEVAATGRLMAVGFNKEPGGVEDYRPTNKSRKTKRSWRCRSKTFDGKEDRQISTPIQKPPSAPKAAAVSPHSIPRHIETPIALTRQQPDAYNIARKRKEESAALIAAQEKSGQEWARSQLERLRHSIRNLQSRGQGYEAALCRENALNILRSYPSLWNEFVGSI